MRSGNLRKQERAWVMGCRDAVAYHLEEIWVEDIGKK